MYYLMVKALAWLCEKIHHSKKKKDIIRKLLGTIKEK